MRLAYAFLAGALSCMLVLTIAMVVVSSMGGALAAPRLSMAPTAEAPQQDALTAASGYLWTLLQSHLSRSPLVCALKPALLPGIEVSLTAKGCDLFIFTKKELFQTWEAVARTRIGGLIVLLGTAGRRKV